MVPMKHTQFDLVCCNYGALDAALAMASNWVVSLRSIKVALATSCWAAPGERTFWWLSSYRALLCKITIWSQLRFSVKMIGFQTKQYRPNIFPFSGISFLNSKKMMFFDSNIVWNPDLAPLVVHDIPMVSQSLVEVSIRSRRICRSLQGTRQFGWVQKSWLGNVWFEPHQ